MFKFIFLLPLLITGCVTSTYQYDWWEYEPIDYNIHHPINRTQLVYIPRYRSRPRPLYMYKNVWYSEPHTIVIYEDSTGYRLRQKVPNSHLKMQLNKSRPFLKRGKDVESIMKRVDEERKKNRHNLKKRREKSKVNSPSVDTNNKSKKRIKNRKRKKGRI